MYKVYCHTFPNGKRYIGITRMSLHKRFSSGYDTCPLMKRAIDKYGWDNIVSQVIDIADSVEEAEQKEKYYIALYHTTDTAFGYNILEGGDVSKCELTDEIRFKLGTGQRGKSRTEIEKYHISQGVKKRFERPESNGHFGLTASDDTKRKMSISQRKSWNNEKRREEASRRMKDRMGQDEFREKVISNLNSLPKRQKGEWKMPDTAKQKLSELNKDKWQGSKSSCSKAVLQFTKDGAFIKEWGSAGEAERAGIALRSNIAKCCRGVNHVKTVGGFMWKYKGE